MYSVKIIGGNNIKIKNEERNLHSVDKDKVDNIGIVYR